MNTNVSNSKSLRKSITLLAVYMIMFANIGYTQYIAEGWQWMKEFQGAELDKEYNSIKQVVMDSAGDYYILGTTGYGGDIDDIALYPEDYLPYNPYIEGGMFLAKIDGYSGDVQWVKKLKHHGMDISFFPASILYNKGKIYLWAEVGLYASLGVSPQSYFYYLDTAYYMGNGIYTGNFDYLSFPFKNTNRGFDAFVTFDLEGNKIDEHFLCLMNRDSIAIDSIHRKHSSSDPLLQIFKPLMGKLAHIDNDGNVYVYTQGCYAYDEVLGRYNIETDTTLPFKIYVDDTIAYEFKTQEYWGTQTCGNSVDNIFLWKFSPELKPLWPEPKPLIKYVDSCSNGFRILQTLGKLLLLDESSTDYDDYMYFHWVPSAFYKEDKQTYPMYVYFDSVNRIKIENRHDLTYTLNVIIKVDTAGNIEWVDKGKYCIPNSGKICGSTQSPSEYMTDSIIYVILNADASSVDNTVYLDEDHRYQVPKCYDLTDNNSDFRIYKKISRRTGEYLGSGTICPKGTSGFEYVFMTDLFEVNDTLYGFASYIKEDFENTGALSSELVHWDKDNNFLGAVDTIATFDETKENFTPNVFATGDGRVLVYGNKSVAYSQAPIYFNDTIHLHFTPESKGYFGMLYDSMFVQRTPMEEEEDDDTISTHSPLLLHPDVKIYPNPTVSYIYVELPDNTGYHKAELWSASGALLQTTTERVLNLHNLSPGTYYIRVHTPKGIGTQKIIKM